MDCLKSFSLTTTAQNTYTTASGGLTVWGPLGNFAIYGVDTSIFNIQGYKNVNIHKIDMIGNVSSAYGSFPRIDNANAYDFEVNVILNGQLPQPIGVIGGSNDWPIILNTTFIQQQYVLSKFKTSVEFATPFTSVTQITLTDFKAFGRDVENPLQVAMGWALQFNFYYTFEGE